MADRRTAPTDRMRLADEHRSEEELVERAPGLQLVEQRLNRGHV